MSGRVIIDCDFKRPGISLGGRSLGCASKRGEPFEFENKLALRYVATGVLAALLGSHWRYFKGCHRGWACPYCASLIEAERSAPTPPAPPKVRDFSQMIEKPRASKGASKGTQYWHRRKHDPEFRRKRADNAAAWRERRIVSRETDGIGGDA